MSRLYEHCTDAGAYEHAVTVACFDLHMYMLHDRDVRAALQNPTSVAELKKARNQLDSIIRKLEFATLAIPGVCRETRQADMQKVEEGVSA